MTILRLSRRNRLALILCLFPAWVYAVEATGGTYDMTKTLVGESGVGQVTNSTNFGASYSLGEDVAGTHSTGPGGYDFVSGYYSGYASGFSGTFNMLGYAVGPSYILRDGLQVGVPRNATVRLFFATPLDQNTVPSGIQVTAILDNMGQAENNLALWTSTYDVTGSTLIISSISGNWQGNTVYNVVGTPNLRSIDGFGLARPTPVQFQTAMDPAQENVVLEPIPVPGVIAAPSAGNGSSLSLDFPAQAFANDSYLLMSQDPVHFPLRVNPSTLQAATQKALSIGGAYQTPLAYEEVVAYNQQGQPVTSSKPFNINVSYTANQGFVGGTSLPIRAGSLSLWSLDTLHSLWVKMPDTQAAGSGVAGPVSQLSVYALAGSASADASSVNVFPNPWRPHGPGAGTGAGQTGTDAGGITFNNLPSECTIKIYTISGGLVRKLTHSDLAGPVGQETWNGNTSGGDHAASGVYLWRVESGSDSKNGKLMVIR